MSLRLPTAAVRTYDQLKSHPKATPRDSDARDTGLLDAIALRLHELISSYRIISTEDKGQQYVFWIDIDREIKAGAFDDLLDRL